MSGYLLDTNVVTEIVRVAPDLQVRTFLPYSLIAGTAIVHNLILATRNVRDSTDLNIDIVNPWEYP